MAPSSAAAAGATQSLDACILAVLRDPFPGRGVAADRFYGSAVEAFAAGRAQDAEKLFSEAYLYSAGGDFVTPALFGHSEIERLKRESVHVHFALGKYDRILAAKSVEPLRELALLRKAQALSAVGKGETALATLAELDPRTKLGRCDAGIRAELRPLLLGLVDGATTLTSAACADARTIASRLSDADVTARVGKRCP